MVIYWGMFIWVFFLGYMQPLEHNPLKSNEATAYRAKWSTALLMMAPIIFFAIFRSECIDTASYIRGFDRTPTDMTLFGEWMELQKGSQLFHGLQMLFKSYISESATLWLGSIAVFQGLIVTWFFKKYSSNIGMTVFIFVGSTLFTWMYNGIRQFIAVAVVLLLTDCIIKNRWYIYLPIAFLLGGFTPILQLIGIEKTPWFLDGIHQSALLLVPILLIVSGKAWNKRMLVFLVAFFLVVVAGGMDFLLETATETVDEYKDDLSYVAADTGANPLRLVVALVPVVMAFVKRKDIAAMSEEECPPLISLCINMSLVTMVMYFASVLTSGIYIGRLPIYTELYNLILIPWLILHPYKKDMKLITTLVYVAYFGWFIYQMHISWNGLAYGSDLLGIHFWGGS